MSWALLIVFLLLCVSVFFNIRFGLTILRFEDVLEDCLDTINDKYEKMTEILSRPLFFDSPEVRKVVEDIRDTRNALHRVAVSLSSNFKQEEATKKDGNAR